MKGEWGVENRGILPDVEVELDSKLVREGHDPQLGKAIEVVMDELRKHPLPTYKKPSYPDYKQKMLARPQSPGGRSALVQTKRNPLH